MSPVNSDPEFYRRLQLIYRELVDVEGLHEDTDQALELVHGVITRLWNENGEPKDQVTVFRWTQADIETLAARPVLSDELDRIRKSIDNSSMNEVLGDIVFAICGSSEDSRA